MGCFLACFGSSKDGRKRGKQSRNKVRPRDHHVSFVFPALITVSVECFCSFHFCFYCCFFRDNAPVVKLINLKTMEYVLASFLKLRFLVFFLFLRFSQQPSRTSIDNCFNIQALITASSRFFRNHCLCSQKGRAIYVVLLNLYAQFLDDSKPWFLSNFLRYPSSRREL